MFDYIPQVLSRIVWLLIIPDATLTLLISIYFFLLRVPYARYLAMAALGSAADSILTRIVFEWLPLSSTDPTLHYSIRLVAKLARLIPLTVLFLYLYNAIKHEKTRRRLK